MPCGLEPHQYDLHEHLFRGRHAGHIPLERRMGALRLAGRRGCRSAALRRLAVTHAPQRKIAPHRTARYGPPPYSGRTPGFRHNRPQALPHTPAASRSASEEPHRVRRAALLLPLRPDAILSPATTAACPRLRPGMPPGLSATESQNRFRTRLPLHRTLRLLYPRRFRRTPRSDVAPGGPNYPKTASERYKQFYLSIN